MFFLEIRTTRPRLLLFPGKMIWFLGRTTDVSPTALELETTGGLKIDCGRAAIMAAVPEEATIYELSLLCLGTLFVALVIWLMRKFLKPASLLFYCYIAAGAIGSACSVSL